MGDTIKDLKEQISIEEYIGSQIELKKSGANFVACCPFHGEDTPSFVVSPTKQIFNCFGTCNTGGDILDFIEKYHNVDNKEAIKILKKFAGSEQTEYKPKNTRVEKAPIRTPQEIQEKIDKTIYAINNSHIKVSPFKFTNLEIDNKNLVDVFIHEDYKKLFEKNSFYLTAKQCKKVSYITTHILKYDTFFRCPLIIMKDHSGKVVDICKYRPKKPESFTDWGEPKYMYIKEEEKLKDRGDNFLFPFSIEMERLIDKSPFFFIGEGLKNALVALLHGVPFISLESVSNKLKPALIEYIKLKADNRIIVGAFDGDGGSKKDLEEEKKTKKAKKGKGAYLNAKEALGFEFDNLFAFDSGVDFAEYLSNQIDLTDFDSKFKELFLTGVNTTPQKVQGSETPKETTIRKYKKFKKSS